ncbi:TAXI family TRAP transporter solute-binding subunit [Arthrobacter sp. MYb213]|uniref:TAXI family TRAP transporter solute-binding subunit n=1 Tax=Arthrobacter sp. MYb213 TaxID=1848595 RepID=UPI0011AFE051|nr:TAXI family TRAP transporter solute-binding subunit [Arthrobacter sp. MYb213]
MSKALDLAPRKIGRRQLLRWGGLSMLATGMTACSTGPLIGRLDVAGGESGGMYFEFANLLCEALVKYNIAESSEALVTEASVENLRLIKSGRAGLSLALADTVAQLKPRDKSLAALGRVYQNYYHCLVPENSSIKTLADLSGRQLGTGAPGSGTWVTGQRILKAAGLDSTQRSPRERQLGYVGGLKALSEGEIEALFLFGGIPVSSITELGESVPLRLIDMSSVLPSLREQYPRLYEHVIIPQGTYRGIDQVDTVGVANLLMANVSLPDRVASAVVELLVNHAPELIPRNSAGIQYLTPDTLISTGGQTLHPAALETYRRLHG